MIVLCVAGRNNDGSFEKNSARNPDSRTDWQSQIWNTTQRKSDILSKDI